jgi:hypothetical protein
MQNFSHCCTEMELYLEIPNSSITYYSQQRQYGILFQKSGGRNIYYCPWCGEKLPEHLYLQFWRILHEEYKLKDPYDAEMKDPNFPEEFRTDLWWRRRDL